MTYQDIMQALKQGLKVHWSNTAYRVFIQSGKLYTIYEHNNYMIEMAEAEYADCFIGD